MHRIRGLIIILATVFWLAAPAAAKPKGWESIKQEKTAGQRVMADTDVEILTARGVIFITTNRNVNIKIFTILGSRIADDNLTPGSYQFTVPTHGVYIIKAGDLTCKVAV